eukprot:gene28215-35034_t
MSGVPAKAPRIVVEKNTNITITTTRLTGVSLAPAVNSNLNAPQNNQQNNTQTTNGQNTYSSMTNFTSPSRPNYQQPPVPDSPYPGSIASYDDTSTVGSASHLSPYHNKPPPYGHQNTNTQNSIKVTTPFKEVQAVEEEELVEDAQEGIQLQMPHLKGEAIEQMLMTVYQRYCGPSGFMSLEEFVEFMEDVNFLNTHAAHNDNDEPTDEFVTLLDPIRLLTLVPRNYGFASSDSTYAISEKLIKAAKSDKFIINFTQFYQLLLRITQIVYADLYLSDATLAFNKLLQEAICPLFVWSKGRQKRGSTDVLVLEERILLILTLYSPNLWKVFLTYAQDAVGKIAEVNQIFPDNAQMNEKGLFRLPPAAPARHLDQKVNVDSLILTDAGCIRFCRDYGIVSHLVTTKELRDIFRRTNRNKTIISSRLPTREQVETVKPANRAGAKKNPVTPMHFGPPKVLVLKGTKTTTAAAVLSQDDDEAPPPPPPLSAIPAATNNKENGVGLGFSEFLELIARVAVDGMTSQANYNLVFPTPFAKVLAILTVWGVADLTKLEEVRTVRTEEYY